MILEVIHLASRSIICNECGTPVGRKNEIALHVERAVRDDLNGWYCAKCATSILVREVKNAKEALARLLEKKYVNEISIDDGGNYILYKLTEEDAKAAAENKSIDSEFTLDELYSIKKGLNSGLNFDLGVVFSAIFDELGREEE